MATRSSGGDSPPPEQGPAPEAWSPLTAGEEPSGAADPRLRTRPFVITEHFHNARFTLVRRLLWLLTGVLAVGAGMMMSTKWTGLAPDEVTDFVTMVFGAILALVGAAVGLYFGGGRAQE